MCVTIDFQFSRVSCHSCRILSPAGVCATVVIVNGGYDKHASLGAQHCGGHCRPRGHDVSLQTPGDGDGQITVTNDTSQLGKSSLVDCVKPKRKGNDLWFLCK